MARQIQKCVGGSVRTCCCGRAGQGRAARAHRAVHLHDDVGALQHAPELPPDLQVLLKGGQHQALVPLKRRQFAPPGEKRGPLGLVQLVGRRARVPGRAAWDAKPAQRRSGDGAGLAAGSAVARGSGYCQGLRHVPGAPAVERPAAASSPWLQGVLAGAGRRQAAQGQPRSGTGAARERRRTCAGGAPQPQLARHRRARRRRARPGCRS